MYTCMQSLCKYTIFYDNLDLQGILEPTPLRCWRTTNCALFLWFSYQYMCLVFLPWCWLLFTLYPLHPITKALSRRSGAFPFSHSTITLLNYYLLGETWLPNLYLWLKNLWASDMYIQLPAPYLKWLKSISNFTWSKIKVMTFPPNPVWCFHLPTNMNWKSGVTFVTSHSPTPLSDPSPIFTFNSQISPRSFYFFS